MKGPNSNPANLEPSTNVFDLFGQLLRGAVETPTAVRFLSRYDKSATNVKEAFIWTTIGQAPWAYPYSNLYHRYNSFPFQALEAAAKLGEYTVVDRGTWYSVDEWIRDSMTVFVRVIPILCFSRCSFSPPTPNFRYIIPYLSFNQ